MKDKPVKTGEADLGSRGARRGSALGMDRPPRGEDSATGRTEWVVPGGRIPLHGTGEEPMFTSHDEVCLLNTSSRTTGVRITVFFTDAEPVGPFPLSLGPRRVRHVRLNDLIFPQAIPLETDYATLILSDHPIVVQFGRSDTRQPENAGMSTTAYHDE